MALRVLLVVLGGLLVLAGRASASFRRAITRDLVFEIASEDGTAHHYVFRDHRVSSRPGRAVKPDCALRFATASQGARTFLSRRAVSHLVAGLLDGTVKIQGNAFHMLWFYDLTQRVIPMARKVRWRTPPGAYVTPSKTAAAAKRITREPAVDSLDPSWEAAARSREKTTMMRVANGGPTIEF